MRGIEFYITPQGDVMINDKQGVRRLSENDRAFIREMISKIDEFYPEALTSLSSIYKQGRHNIPHFEFLIVSRFLRCNFGKYDNTLDIDQCGNLNFEEVSCPLRGECANEGIICNPKFNSKLSNREIEIMQHFYNGYSYEAISEKMYISTETVKTHRRNALKRTNTHSIAEFFIFARDNNLFIKSTIKK